MIGTSGSTRLDRVLRPIVAVFLIFPTETANAIRRWRARRRHP